MSEDTKSPDEPDPHEADSAADPAAQGSGNRPSSPADATTPPGNPDVDPERLDQAKEDQGRTKPY